MSAASVMPDLWVAIVRQLPGAQAGWTEDQWARLVALIDHTGRYFLNLPAPRADELAQSFGLYDMIGDARDELETARQQTEAATAAATTALSEVRDLGSTTLALDEVWAAIADLQRRPEPTPDPEPPAKPQGRGGWSPEQIEAARKLNSAIEPQVPSAEDERMFAAVRAGSVATYAELDRQFARTPNTSRQRMMLLRKYGTLPTDIDEWCNRRRPGPPRRPSDDWSPA